MSPAPSQSLHLVILDANIIIKAFELNVWDKLVAKYCITVLSAVVKEADFYEDNDGHLQTIDLTQWITDGKIIVETVTPDAIKGFISKTDKSYYDRIDPGELESLTFLFQKTDSDYLICSADHIVYKTLGRFNVGEKGISLEKMLQQIGQTKKLPVQYTEKFRKERTTQGGTDFIYNFKT